MKKRATVIAIVLVAVLFMNTVPFPVLAEDDAMDITSVSDSEQLWDEVYLVSENEDQEQDNHINGLLEEAIQEDDAEEECIFMEDEDQELADQNNDLLEEVATEKDSNEEGFQEDPAEASVQTEASISDAETEAEINEDEEKAPVIISENTETVSKEAMNGAEYDLSDPRTEAIVNSNGQSDLKTTWDCIWFGSYPQNGSTADSKDPIKWRVLSVSGNDAFILADQNLECQQYHTDSSAVTWENCALRAWLNNDFYYSAFSSSEQRAIMVTMVENTDHFKYGYSGGNNTYDNVFLLNYHEVTNPSYGFLESAFNVNSKTRQAKNSAYAKAQGAYDSSESRGYGGWWLREPCAGVHAVSVTPSGSIGLTTNNTWKNRVVRPALHINLSFSSWSYAGTVCSDGTVEEPETPEPQVNEVRYITAQLEEDTYVIIDEPVEPKPIVYYIETNQDGTKTTELSEDEYTLTYENNDKPGTASVTVAGRGKYADLSETQEFTIVAAEKLTIRQPKEGKKYAYAGNKLENKTFTMTLDQVDEEPQETDFHFVIKRSNNLTTIPSQEVADPSVEIKQIKKTSDRKYDIIFDYSPDETGLFGLTVSYKDNVDDTELMVYDSNLLEKLEKDLDGTVKAYYGSYSKRVKAEIKRLLEETEEEIDYILLAQELMKDSSNLMNGTGIGDSDCDVASLNLCAFEAYARFLHEAGGRSGVDFDEVDNKTAASKIVNSIKNYITDNHGISESDVSLDAKAVIDGVKYSVKASWDIWAFGYGQIQLKVMDKGRELKIYLYSWSNLKEANSSVADYIEALKELEISSMKNVASSWYKDLVEVLEWDILADVDKKREEMLKGISDDITEELEKRGIKNILDNIKACHDYYKQAKRLIEKVRDAEIVFKNPSSTLGDKLASIGEIRQMKLNSLEPGDCSKDIYNKLKTSEEQWREYMKEYFTTGTIKELEPDHVFDVVKNGIKNIFKCPITVSVIDPYGNIVGYVGDDDIWFDDSVFIEEDGDTKTIYTPKAAGYRFEVIGTDDGTVSYTAEDIIYGNSSGNRLNYYDMPVEKGTIIKISLNMDSVASGGDISITCEETIYEPEMPDPSSTVVVSVNNDDIKGEITGAGNYKPGDIVTVKAKPFEKYVFVGWYEGDQLKSITKTYRFEARKDTTLTAKYIDAVEDEVVEDETPGNNDNENDNTEDAKTSINNSDVYGITDMVYTGKALTQSLIVKNKNTVLKTGTDYTISYMNNTNAGTAKVTITGKGNYTGTVTRTFKINKAENTLTVKVKKQSIKYSKLKKKRQIIKAKKAFAVVGAQGELSFKVAKYDQKAKKKIAVSKTGKITVGKGLKKGTYKLKVKVTAAGGKNYKPATKTGLLKVIVK